MPWVHIYWWLEANNLWKACVAWGVGLTLNAAWAIRLWIKKQREDKKRHDDLVNLLDTETPGGLGELKRIIQEEQEDPDDNGTDVDDAERRKGHGSGHAPEHGIDIMHGVKGGDAGAGHR